MYFIGLPKELFMHKKKIFWLIAISLCLCSSISSSKTDMFANLDINGDSELSINEYRVDRILNFGNNHIDNILIKLSIIDKQQLF